jgi:hypothetical protein
MKFLLKTLLVVLLFFGGVSTVEAGKRKQEPKLIKFGQSSVSFRVVVGAPSPRRPILVYRGYRQKLAVKNLAAGCSVRQAASLAREFGIRYQTIYRTSRMMTVVGYRNGRPAKLKIYRKLQCDIFK